MGNLVLLIELQCTTMQTHDWMFPVIGLQCFLFQSLFFTFLSKWKRILKIIISYEIKFHVSVSDQTVAHSRWETAFSELYMVIFIS